MQELETFGLNVPLRSIGQAIDCLVYILRFVCVCAHSCGCGCCFASLLTLTLLAASTCVPTCCSGAVETKCTARELHTALRTFTDLRLPCCDAIAKAYMTHVAVVEARTAAAAAAAAAAATSTDGVEEQHSGVAGRMPSIGSLVSADWRLGITVQGSNSDAVEVPYVNMVLRTSDADGRVKGHPLHLTLTEFKVCMRTRTLAHVT